MVTVVEFLNAAIKNRPVDASDVNDLASARTELARLRRVCGRVCDILDPGSNQRDKAGGATPDAKGSTPPKKPKAKREALQDNQEHLKYVKTDVPKTDAERELIKTAISANTLFQGTTEVNFEDFVDVFEKKVFPKDSTVIKQGDEGFSFYVVESGTLDIYIKGGEGGGDEMQVGVPYMKGGSFGELALIYNSGRAATIKSAESCVLWKISKLAFRGLRHQHEQKAHTMIISQLSKVKVGGHTFAEALTNDDIESMALATNLATFDAGEVIVREGETGDVFYIIIDGTVDVFQKAAGENKIASLGESSFFGEKALLDEDVRKATCKAASTVHCLTLQRDDFNRMLGNLDDILKGKRKTSPLPNVPAPITKPQSAPEEEFTMDGLDKLNVLGEGAFGKVNLVRSKATKKLYALKAQGKAFVVENNQQTHLLTEYQVMLELDHPFIVKCAAALQDSKYIYFLMTLLPGGELMDLLDAKGEFKESWSRFYGASVISAFITMHSKKIAYRDLKPENLVLNEDGYCYVIDFGLAKRIDEGKTWTFCGTPDYLAPEIIRGKGHDWGVDYWGFGVLLYELTHGYPPFYAGDPTSTARKILKGAVSFPPKFTPGLTDLITGLLSDQSKRLGRTQGGGEKIMKHRWFAGFDWEALMAKKMSVPYVPKLGNLEKLGSKDDGPAKVVPDSNWTPVLG